MARGGKREGAGRPAGVRNKRTTERFQKLEAEGEMPLEHLLRRMRDKAVDDAVRLDCAKAAAPYCHPRLASTEVSGKDGGAIEVAYSNRDVARAILELFQEAKSETSH